MRIRSGFSFRNAFGFLEDVIERIDTPYAPLTDRGSAYGHNPWRKLCEKAGKKPIYGLEVAVTDSPNAKAMNLNHVTLIATETLAPINRALELATSKFRYEPLLTYSDLNSLDPSVAVIIGRRIDPELLDPARKWRLAMGPSTPTRMLKMAADRDWELIASSDNTYPKVEDRHAYQVLMGRDANTQTWVQHILSNDELLAYASIEAMQSRDRLAEMCVAEMLHPKLVGPATGYTLEEWCEEEAGVLGVDLNDPVYAARYQRELQVIHQLGFDDYFLIIADLVRFARSKMFVGPARGSSCGSLVCYLMGITTVDPIKHDLLFERFLDPGRTDLPDIDIDFSDQNRDMVFDYLADKYGKSRTARLGTISYFRERSVTKELSGAFQIPGFKFEALVNAVETNEGDTDLAKVLANTEDGRKLMKEYPELELISRIEGHPRHHSTHAAGVVVTDKPVTDYIAVDARSNTAEIDKHDAEDLGFLKIDALGLKQLSIFEDCLQMIGKPHSWLLEVPLDDPGAFKVLNDRLFSGVFQYNGRALQQVSSSFTIEEFEDMVATTALARPGPMGAGGTEKWIQVRLGNSKPNVSHPAFESVVGKTKGIVLYQEQVMQAGREIGGMDWARVTKLRKAVQYFGGAKGMEEFRDEFMAGAKEREIPELVAKTFWDDLLTYGSYAFNRSHAVAYSLISYWCCYLKAHHPVQYAAAMLNHEAKEERQRQTLRELAAEGIHYTPVDPKQSGMKWRVMEDGTLLGPLTLVDGLGHKTALEYMRCRDAGVEPPKRAVKLLSAPVTPLDSLAPVRTAISRNHPDLREIKIYTEPTPINEIGDQKQRDLLIMGRLIQAKPRKNDKTGGTKMTALLEDDTGEVKIFFNDRNYREQGEKMLESGRVGQTLWAIKGSTPPGGGIVFVDLIRYLGEFK